MESLWKKKSFLRVVVLTFFVLMVMEFSLNIFGFASFKFDSSLWRQLNQSRQIIDEITHSVQNLEFLINEIQPTAVSADKRSLPLEKSRPPHAFEEKLSPAKKYLLTIRNVSSTAVSSTTSLGRGPTTLPLCPDPPPKLVGMLRVSKVPMELLAVEKLHASDMLSGGLFKPPGCVARHRVAIIIPFRDREEHLHIFLNHLLPILKRQLLEFRIYVIDLIPGVHFNRAMLMNIGFAESIKVSLLNIICELSSVGSDRFTPAENLLLDNLASS